MTPEALERHNEQQRRYFSRGIKPRMVPRGAPHIHRQLDELIRFAGIQPHHLILDAGCGMGRYTLPLAERGLRVEGLDLTPFLLDQLRQADGGRFQIPFYCADLIHHPPELTGRYDFIVGFFTLHHLHDFTACYRGMWRMLKPGGQVVFLEPNAYNPLFYLQILITPGMTWEGDKGMGLMRRSILFPAMREAGFTDLRLERFGFLPPVLYNRRWGPRLDAVLETVPLWRSLRPYQLIAGVKPGLRA
jgi:SAM-dependent methyltransferase